MDNPRVFLRPLREDEVVDKYVQWHDQPHFRFYSASGRKFGRESLITEMREGRDTETLFVYGLYYRDGVNGKLIGNVKVGPICRRHQTSDLPVMIGDTDYLHKGLALEAIVLGMELAFGRHQIRKLCGGMYRSNYASINAYMAAGWVIEGCLEEQYLVDGKPEARVLVAYFKPEH